jgi:signal transduction histidine kinase
MLILRPTVPEEKRMSVTEITRTGFNGTAGGIRELQRAAVLGERSRIAREIHDVLAHSLGALSIQVQLACALLPERHDVDASRDALESALHMVSAGLIETRRAVHALREDVAPLPEQLTRMVTEHRVRHGVSVCLEVMGAPRELSPETTQALARTAQESLVNAAKHSAEQTLALTVVYAERNTTLVVVNQLAASSSQPRFETSDSGYGLTGMRARLLLLDGSLSAGPSDGSWIVRAQVPR